MTDEEMAGHIDAVYEKFLAGEVEVPGRDLCDMSGAKARCADTEAGLLCSCDVSRPERLCAKYTRWQTLGGCCKRGHSEASNSRILGAC